jgi:hypothetical protein
MKADSFAKLIVLEALIEAEIGYYLERRPTSLELFREGMVARISDLIDEIDVLDSVAAGRVYDAIVDFLAELPDHEEGVVEAAIRFRSAVDRIIERGMDRRDLAVAATWAVVLDQLLAELADEYHMAVDPEGVTRPREYARTESLLARSRIAADRMLWGADVASPEVTDGMDRLTFAVRHRRIRPANVDLLIRSLQRQASKYRPSTLSRIGAFVLRQVMGRERRPRPTGGRRAGRGARANGGASRRAG